MATRIFDIALDEAGRNREGITGFEQALFLLREGRRPVGQVTVPIRDGLVWGAEVLRSISPSIIHLASVARAEAALDSGLPPEDISATAVICTHERPEDLTRALQSLVSLDRRRPILVVDNCPATTATRDVVARFPDVRYVVEPLRGLDNARNRALRETATEIVAFIDDDAVADPGWLEEIVNEFADPAVGCVTGLTMPLELETIGQEKFESLAGFSRRGFERRAFRLPQTDPLATGQMGAGANMAVRRSIIATTGEFDPALGAGTPSQAGDEHEFFTRVLRAGFTIVYQPSAVNFHRHRRSINDLLVTVRGYGTGIYASWTKMLLVDGEWGVLRRAVGWFLREQLPNMARGLVYPTDPLRGAVARAELAGCLQGPFAYFRSRRQMRRLNRG